MPLKLKLAAITEIHLLKFEIAVLHKNEKEPYFGRSNTACAARNVIACAPIDKNDLVQFRAIANCSQNEKTTSTASFMCTTLICPNKIFLFHKNTRILHTSR